MRMIRLVLAALFAITAISAMSAAGASAGEPLFLTVSGKALLFTADSGLGILRGGTIGLIGTIHCERSLTHGFVLHKSPLAREVEIQFEKDCLESINGGNPVQCTEPIVVKKSLGELGLILPANTLGLLLAPESGTKFTETVCGSTKTPVEGAVIGEFPPTDGGGNQQYNVDRTDFLLVFKAKGTSGKEPIEQAVETIDLLGVEMKGVKLKVEGVFGESASQEQHALILLAGQGLIDT